MLKKTLSDPLVFLFGKIVNENIIPVTRNADRSFFKALMKEIYTNLLYI